MTRIAAARPGAPAGALPGRGGGRGARRPLPPLPRGRAPGAASDRPHALPRVPPRAPRARAAGGASCIASRRTRPPSGATTSRGSASLCPVSGTTARWLGARRRARPRALAAHDPPGRRARGGAGRRPPAGALRDQRHGPGGALQPRRRRPDPAGGGLPPDLPRARGARSSPTRPISSPSSCAGWRPPRAGSGGGASSGVAFVEEAAPLDGYSEVPRLVAAFREAGIRAVRGTAARAPPRAGRRAAPRRGGRRRLPGPGAGGSGAAGAPAGSTASSTASMRAPCCRASRASSARRVSSSASSARRSRASSRRPSAGSSAGPCRGRGSSGPGGRRIRRAAGWTCRSSRGARGSGLLIKPNVGSSGAGILLGREAGPARWEARIARALREPGRWVVQARRPGTRRPVLYLRGGRAHAGAVLLLPGPLLRSRGPRPPLSG